MTVPAGAPSRSRSRVWSMCSSTKPRSRASHDGASASAPGSAPNPRIASPSATPSSSRAGERVGHVEPADQRARAERRRVEARALLVGEGEHGDARHALRDREARGDAERPVEAPAGAHAVEVRAGRPPRPVALRQRPERARRVARHPQPGGARPARGTTSRPPRAPPSRRAGRRRPRGSRCALQPERAGRAARPPSIVTASPATPGRAARARARPPAITAATGLWPEPVGDVLRRSVEQQHVAGRGRAAEHPGGVERATRAAPRARSSRSGARRAR